MEKRCCRCKLTQPTTEFTKDKKQRDGLTLVCKECKREIYRNNVKSGKIVYVPVLKRKLNPRGLTAGVGINDAPYVVRTKDWTCPFYSVWAAMLNRAYKHKDRPTYEGCSVCEEWHLFSTFKSWMESQNWKGLHLDKDILLEGNKVYSPTTCAFVPNYLNIAVAIDRRTSSYGPGVYLIGKIFAAKMTVQGSSVEIGRYKTVEAATKAYENAKAGALEELLEKYKLEPSYNCSVENAILNKINKFRSGE